MKTGIFCPRCQRRLNSNEFADYEVTVMKKLLELEERGLKELKDVHYIKSIQHKGILVLMIKSPEFSESLSKKLSKELSLELNLKVKVIEYTKDIRKLTAQLLSPARVLGVNMLWLPDGSEVFSVRVLRVDERLLPTEKENLEEILHMITKRYFLIKLE